MPGIPRWGLSVPQPSGQFYELVSVLPGRPWDASLTAPRAFCVSVRAPERPSARRLLSSLGSARTSAPAQVLGTHCDHVHRAVCTRGQLTCGQWPELSHRSRWPAMTYPHTVEEEGAGLLWQLLPAQQGAGDLGVCTDLELFVVEQSGGQCQQGRVGPVVLHELCDLQAEGRQQGRGQGQHAQRRRLRHR